MHTANKVYGVFPLQRWLSVARLVTCGRRRLWHPVWGSRWPAFRVNWCEIFPAQQNFKVESSRPRPSLGSRAQACVPCNAGCRYARLVTCGRSGTRFGGRDGQPSGLNWCEIFRAQGQASVHRHVVFTIPLPVLPTSSCPGVMSVHAVSGVAVFCFLECCGCRLLAQKFLGGTACPRGSFRGWTAIVLSIDNVMNVGANDDSA